MAKPTTHATPICIAVTVTAAVGLVIGLATGNALYPILTLLPAVGYEAYRTEGESTRWASWGLVVTLVAVLVLLIFKIDVDLVTFFGETEKTVGGYQVPLGDIKVVGAALVVVLSLILITRTRGIYTRWLAVVIIVGSLGAVYVLAPDAFADLFRSTVNEGINGGLR